jgi:VIT1/CCC1 family predicted Fe2+/Mn2+ transporter
MVSFQKVLFSQSPMAGAVISVVVVPVLCAVEGWFVARAWIGGRPPRSYALRWHAIGLGIGIGAILAVLAVR